MGNRLSNLGGSGWSYNTSNELTARPGVTYTYDNNGNTLTKVVSGATTTYAWDFENRLTSVTLPGSGGTVAFKYDPFGRGIYKSSSSGTSIFAYDGDNLVEETNATGGVVARYSQGLNIDEPLALLRGGTTSYHEADGLSSVTSLSNSSGSITDSYTFDSFGNLTASSGTTVNPFRYTARELDTETNLYFLRNRYYDPTTGRFISEDPSDFAGGINFYWYVGNEPTIFVDPSGLKGEKLPQPQKQKIPGSAVYFICCKKKTFAFCEGSAGGGPMDWIGDCERQHEKQHVTDFQNGIVPRLTTFCQDPSNDGKAVLVNTGDEKNRVECSGYKKELQCLQPAGQQLQSIKDRRKYVQQQIDKYCGACESKK